MLLILLGMAISTHATPHECVDGLWAWPEIGEVCLGLTVIWLMGFFSGVGVNNED